ncbi:hypothetical protein DPMN_051122 [Dreissena polymorpha]|uniref:Uncharacterized protein n=1 Tax=Dreissena polymorpha TaxID=45954 RepID=A0A9D4CIV2_DREPO|nr:hypothetical protein DPMN_051122 [Dreissena polymorpha]
MSDIRAFFKGDGSMFKHRKQKAREHQIKGKHSGWCTITCIRPNVRKLSKMRG